MTDETNRPTTEAAKVTQLAIAAAGKRIDMGLEKLMPGEQPVAMVPDDCALVSLEQYMPAPAFIDQTLDFTTVESFLRYWKMFSTPEVSLVLADEDSMGFTGRIDYHNSADDGGASWNKHRIYYTCPQSREWRVWQGKDGSKMSQTEFALFIEDNIEDISQRDGTGPTGAEMLEIATKLEVTNNIKFKSSKRLDNGEVQLTYNEDINGTDRTGNIKIPQKFHLAIPVFKGDAPYIIEARLRYRMSTGNIVFWYDLYRPDKIRDDAFDRVYEQISEAIGADSMLRATASDN